jgi:nucleotide-binding universal stress UspA family protein
MATILIATDGSQAAESAVELGVEIAKATHDELVIVSVWDMIRSGIGAPFGYIDQRYIDADRARAAEVLEAARARASRLGVSVETELLWGEPVHEICKAAVQHHARMIVIGAHGWSAAKALVHGSVVAGVLRYAPCPVLTGAPGTRELLDRELLAGERDSTATVNPAT